MKNLKNYNVIEINKELATQINGGVNRESVGYRLGGYLHSLWDSFVSSFEDTGAGTANAFYNGY